MDPIAVLYENDARMSPLFDALDIDALANFVTDAPTLVGFDPHARFAHRLVERASAGASRNTLEVLA